jgi:uncharacterized protein (DUF952 family)
MTPQIAFKILTAEQWAEFERDQIFVGSQVDIADGYIHLSTAEQLHETLAKHYAGQENLKIAEVDLGIVCTVLRWEPSRGGQLFPHLYGPLPMTAIRSVQSH